MPAISLVICVYRERDLLERLLRESESCYDDLVVVHDGPDTENLRAIVETRGGRFFEGPRAYQQEPHWPFAWGQARHDWILRLDADEFPGAEMKSWLARFRAESEPPENLSGYTCLWPLWNGSRETTHCWPGGRNFFFHRQRVRFFGMVEQTPIPDGAFVELPLILHHQPARKSYGIRNILFRKQAYHWRRVIALSLLGPPTNLHCWRWTSEEWPAWWKEIRNRPLYAGVRKLFLVPLWQTREIWRAERKIMPGTVLGSGLHPFLIAITFIFVRMQQTHSKT
jgi:glycosyltransferase involved in cell wall biosynthesis